jgi:ribonuclease E
LQILRIIQEESLKDGPRVRAKHSRRGPVERKRTEIAKIELKQRINVLDGAQQDAGNAQLQTSNAHDDPRLTAWKSATRWPRSGRPDTATRAAQQPTNKQTPITGRKVPDASTDCTAQA